MSYKGKVTDERCFPKNKITIVALLPALLFTYIFLSLCGLAADEPHFLKGGKWTFRRRQTSVQKTAFRFPKDGLWGSLAIWVYGIRGQMQHSSRHPRVGTLFIMSARH